MILLIVMTLVSLFISAVFATSISAAIGRISIPGIPSWLNKTVKVILSVIFTTLVVAGWFCFMIYL